MSKYFGMPGPGGSLGKCAVCGRPFLLEPATEFSCQGIEERMFCHDPCRKMIEDCAGDWHGLPEGPLRKAFEEHDAKNESP